MKVITAKVATKLTLTAKVMKAAAALMRAKGYGMASALDAVARSMKAAKVALA